MNWGPFVAAIVLSIVVVWFSVKYPRDQEKNENEQDEDHYDPNGYHD